MSAQAEFASALLDPEASCPRDLRAWNGSDVSRRFAVYRNNVVVSLANALADSFPVVQELVGPEFFRATASVFVRTHPPRSPLLAEFGSEFPSFLTGFEPARSVPYLADVARLELARVEAFHAADAPALASSVPSQSLATASGTVPPRILLHPSVRIVQSRFPVYSIWAAHQGGGELESVDLGQAEAALVVRPELEVLVVSLEAAVATFVESLVSDEGLQGALAATARTPGFDLTGTLAFLLHHRAIVSIHVPSGDLP